MLDRLRSLFRPKPKTPPFNPVQDPLPLPPLPPSGAQRRKSGTGNQRNKKGAPAGLTLDQKLDIVGFLMVGVGAVSLLSLFSPNQSPILDAWLNLLVGAAGWGVFGLPLGLMLVGGWIIVRKFGDRLPPFEPARAFGLVLMYVMALISLHLAAFTMGVPVTQPQCAPRPDLFALACEGVGGGLVGAFLLNASFGVFGESGTVVMLACGWLISFLLAAQLSLPDIMLALAGAWRSLQPRTPERSLWARPDPAEDDPPATRPAAPTSPAKPSRAEAARARAEARQASKPAPATPAPDAPPLPALDQPLVLGDSQTWELPDLTNVLEPGTESAADDEYDRKRVQVIETTLASFGAPVKVVEVNRGPTITQFGVEPDFVRQKSGKETKVKVGKIVALKDDLALALSARSVRIEAPVPGKGYVGIEVPNDLKAMVTLRDVMEADTFARLAKKSQLALGIGQNVSGEPIAVDLGTMPHLLIAGTTGSGKSVCVNAIIACLLLRNTPDEVKFLMVDPKRVELTGYNGIPHMFAPVVVELERVVASLQWATREMDERYRKFAKLGVRNITDYNERMAATGDKAMPFIVVIIDELADLMMLAPDETERLIARLAQLARATGIHLIIATQRPSVDVVTGLIKANFPARIAFAVASSVDSRVILDQPGAESLLGRGDMLMQLPDSPAPLRMQGVYVSDKELNRLVTYWKKAKGAVEPVAASSGAPQHLDTLPPISLGGLDTTPPRPAKDPIPLVVATPGQPAPKPASPPTPAPKPQMPIWDPGQFATPANTSSEGADDLLEEAIAFVRDQKKASISLLQRQFRIGYTRAARLVDALEERGIIGPAESGAKPREVIDFGATVEKDQEKPTRRWDAE